MAWWHQFFSHPKTHLHHNFGRGINAQVNPDERSLFDQSVSYFEQNRFILAYEAFLQSLINFKDDKSEENLIIQKSASQLHFTLYQGLAIVKGSVSEKSLDANVKIVYSNNFPVALKRDVLEKNYQLTYSRFFIKENTISFKLHIDNTTMTPQKVFYPLRELALNAEYEKEYISSEFSDEKLLEIEHIHYLPKEELETKYRFLQNWIQTTQEHITHLPSNENSGMIAFSYLNLLFKIDYLIVPRAHLGQELIKKITEYFADNEKLVERRNQELNLYIQSLQELPIETFSKQLYNTKNTFSPMERTNHEDIAQFIEDSLVKLRWYRSNRYTQVIPTIYEYIAVYILYNYGVHPSLQSLVHLIVEIQHGDFFEALGYEKLYDSKEKEFNKKMISKRIKESIEPYQNIHPQLEPFGDLLDYSSLEEFSHSYYLQLKHLDYTEISS